MAAQFFEKRRARFHIKPGSLVLVGPSDDRGHITLKIIDDPKIVAEFRKAVKAHEIKPSDDKPPSQDDQ